MHTFIKISLFMILLLGAIELTMNEVIKSLPEEAITVTSFKNEEDLSANEIPELEMFLVSQERKDGELMETYREYEVYYDEHGNVIKKTPTSNYNYIYYKDN